MCHGADTKGNGDRQLCHEPVQQAPSCICLPIWGRTRSRAGRAVEVGSWQLPPAPFLVGAVLGLSAGAPQGRQSTQNPWG